MESLIALYELIPGSSAAARWQELADRLNRLAGRHWTGTYIQGIAGGSVPATRTVRAAAAQLGAVFDGSPAHLATQQPRQVFSDPRNDIAGAFVMGRAKSCEKCGAPFVGNVPWR